MHGQQVYRIYHIYSRNVWICIAPSMVILALLGEFVLLLVFPIRRPSSVKCELLADVCGLVYQLRDPVFNGKAVQNWCTVSFCLTIL